MTGAIVMGQLFSRNRRQRTEMQRMDLSERISDQPVRGRATVDMNH
jgi:hypothetical protein